MNTRAIRLVAWFTPVATLALLLSCRDSATPDRPTLATAPGRADARTRLHQRNKYDWVGVAHNRAIDDFRQELRKPGRIARNLCEYLGRRDVERRVLTTSNLCGRGNASQVTWSTTEALLADVENAIEAASDSYELAARLHAVLDAAGALSASEQEVIGATVSVAQSSYEYWEAQFPGFAQEVVAEYGTCADQYRYSGYSSDDIRDICVNGGAAQMSQPYSPQSMVRFASFATAALPSWFKSVAKADARGAFAGALFGGLAGAGSAGGAASIARGIVEAWDAYLDLM